MDNRGLHPIKKTRYDYRDLADMLPTIMRWVLPNKGQPDGENDYWYKLKIVLEHPQYKSEAILEVNENTFSTVVGLFAWDVANRKLSYELTANYLLSKLPSRQERAEIASILKVNRWLAFKDALEILARITATQKGWAFDSSVLNKSWRNDFIGNAKYRLELIRDEEGTVGIPRLSSVEQIRETLALMEYHASESVE